MEELNSHESGLSRHTTKSLVKNSIPSTLTSTSTLEFLNKNPHGPNTGDYLGGISTASGVGRIQFTSVVDTYYIYSFDGKLMAEYDHDGNCVKDYIYSGNRLIAEYQHQTNKYYYYMSDHHDGVIMTGSSLAWQHSHCKNVLMQDLTPLIPRRENECIFKEEKGGAVIMKNYKNFIINHYKKNWGDKFRERYWKEGPIHQLNKEFCVLEYPESKKRKMWTYATCCMSSLDDNPKVEIHLFSPTKEDKHVELLTVIAHYHKTGNPINLNHSINFGRPWFEKSNCSYGLISLPYLDGPELEIMETENILIRFLWLIPVTKNEIEYKKKNGIEKLEDLFENKKFNYSDKYRKSVV